MSGILTGVACELNAPEAPLKLAGNFGTKHNSCLAFAYQHDVIVVVRLDDEHLNGISIFSHAALRRDPPECYHLVMPGQQKCANVLKQFRQLTMGDKGEEIRAHAARLPVRHHPRAHRAGGGHRRAA